MSSFDQIGTDMFGKVLDGILAVEKRRSFLERAALGLHSPQPDESELKHEPASVDKVVLPLEGVKGDRVGILVENNGSHDGEIHRGETLGTNEEGKNFDGVGDEQWRIGDGIERVEDEHESEESSSSTNVGGLLICGRHGSDNRVGDKHTTSRNNEEWTTTGLFNAQGSSDSNND